MSSLCIFFFNPECGVLLLFKFPWSSDEKFCYNSWQRWQLKQYSQWEQLIFQIVLPASLWNKKKIKLSELSWLTYKNIYVAGHGEHKLIWFSVTIPNDIFLIVWLTNLKKSHSSYSGKREINIPKWLMLFSKTIC